MSEIYAYWEGEDRHWFYDLCWETVMLHNPKAILLSPGDVRDILGEIPEPIRKSYVTHRCDWIRKMVVAKLGGAWLDMDYICWSNLSFLPAMSSNFDYVGYREWGGGWMDNFFAGRKDSVILETAAEYAFDLLNRGNGRITWLGASTQALHHAFARHPWCLFNQLPTHVVSPVSCREEKFFMGQRSEDQVQGYSALGCMASFHTLKRGLSKLSRKEVLSGKTGMSEAFRRAFGTSRKRTSRRTANFDERVVKFDWQSISPTHVPVAFRSENLGDDIQSLIAMELWGIDRIVDRDNPADWPENAVVPLIGWWGRAAFPARATVKVVGFHCAQEGVEQVMENASWFRQAVEKQGFPAFCRDIFTRNLLRRLGIPAEFGGCVSLTARRERDPGRTHLAIDAGVVPEGYDALTNISYELQRMRPEKRLEKAAERLEEIRKARGIRTSRLHVWLPSLAIGVPVRLQSQRMESRERLGGYNLDAIRLEDLFPKGEPPSLYRMMAGWMDYEDLLRDIANGMPENGVFVELGVYQGRSLCYMAEYLAWLGKKARIVGYDIFDPSRYSLPRPRFGENVTSGSWAETIESEIGFDWCSVVPSRSDEAAMFHEDGSVDAVFIDASHKEEDVLADIRAWLPKLKEDGIMAGHDFTPRFPGVKRAVARAGLEVRPASYQCWAFDRRKLP